MICHFKFHYGFVLFVLLCWFDGEVLKTQHSLSHMKQGVVQLLQLKPGNSNWWIQHRILFLRKYSNVNLTIDSPAIICSSVIFPFYIPMLNKLMLLSQWELRRITTLKSKLLCSLWICKFLSMLLDQSSWLGWQMGCREAIFVH